MLRGGRGPAPGRYSGHARIKPLEQVEQVADLKSAHEKESIDVWDHMPIPRNAVPTHGVFLPPDLALNLSETLSHQRGAL